MRQHNTWCVCVRPVWRGMLDTIEPSIPLHRGKVRPGRDADPSPPSSAEVKNRVKQCLYPP